MNPTSFRSLASLPRLAAVAAWAVILAGPASIPAMAQTATPSMNLRDTLPNLRQPRAALLTAGQPPARAWKALAADGVTTVINLRPTDEMGGRDEAAEVAAAGLRYHALPVAGAGDITTDNARGLWTLIAQAQAHGKVLVHCASGNRVGALLAIAAAGEGGVSAEQALQFGRAAGLAGLEPLVREQLALPPAP
ncbi:beta-lactamase hydrolase domain-containing protein [Lysobacter cavernae]|uniref:Beta-lactamase hydrolase domain-containing protein n=1 Tax=Lysobacter cavernae TaxID=1685901 RepID=A0ABV7RMN6_9GAMM